MHSADAASVTVPISAQSFLHEIVDYAGLFPPARLPLDEAIRNFARYRQSADSWMLNRFVVPVGRLTELDAFEDLFRVAPPFRFSVLGSGGDDPATMIGDDLASTRRFETRHKGQVACEMMELRLDPNASERHLVTTLRTVADAFHSDGRNDIEIFLEVPWQEHADFFLTMAAGAVAHARSTTGIRFGLKIRSGGLEADLFPTPERLARFIAVCSTADVPFKATAGLHHPFRLYHESVQAKMHGFVNVFGGAALLHAGRISEAQLVTLLEDEDPTSFAFDADTFRWRDYAIDEDEITSARRFATTFGSCSFDEPREDLRALRFL